MTLKSIRFIRRGIPEEGPLLFETERFTYPGFVEFDDVNSKVLTLSTSEK